VFDAGETMRISLPSWSGPETILFGPDTLCLQTDRPVGKEGWGKTTFLAVNPDATYGVALDCSRTASTRMAIFNVNGVTLHDISGTVGEAGGVAVSPTNIYVSSKSSHCIVVFDRRGVELSRHGSSGRTIGNLWSPLGIVLKGDELFVADSQNNRIQALHLQTGAWRLVVSVPWPHSIAVHPHDDSVAAVSYEHRKFYLVVYERGEKKWRKEFMFGDLTLFFGPGDTMFVNDSYKYKFIALRPDGHQCILAVNSSIVAMTNGHTKVLANYGDWTIRRLVFDER